MDKTDKTAAATEGQDCCWIGEPCLEHNPEPILRQAKYAAELLSQAAGALQNLIRRIEKERGA